MSKNEGELSLGCGITILGAVFIPMLLLSLGSVIWGWYQISEQHRLLSTAEQTNAVVISSSVESQANTGTRDGETFYTPVVQFTFTLNEENYESTMVSPGRDAGPHNWADEMVGEFPAGRKTTAYYDPADPSAAFLLLDYQTDPYLWMAFASLFAGVAVIFPASFFWPFPKVRAGMALAATIVYGLPVIILNIHYFSYASPTHSQAATWATVAIGVAVIPLALTIRWWLLDPQRVAKKMNAEA